MTIKFIVIYYKSINYVWMVDFDSHHIIKYLLFIVITEKISTQKFFVRFPLNNDASERYDLLAGFWCSLTIFLAIVPAKGKKAGKG